MRTQKHSKFIRRSRLRNTLWPLLALPAFIAIVLAWSYLATHHPMLANPLLALDELAMGRADREALVLLAGAAPIAISLIFTLALCCIVVSFGAWLDKRRMLKILSKMDAELNGVAPRTEQTPV